MKINEVTFPAIGRSVKYNFYDILDVVKDDNGKLKVVYKDDRPPETYKSGVYVWHHPDFGYFYVGIAADNNFDKRWTTHIHKLLDRCKPGIAQTRNWLAFSTKFFGAGYGYEDLKDITIRFFPMADVNDFNLKQNPGNKEAFKQYIKQYEARLIKWLNPACNTEYKKPTVEPTVEPTEEPTEEPEQ